MYFPENCVAAFVLAFYLSLKLPCEQRLLSSMAFSFHEVVLVASRLRCWFVYLNLPPRETGGVKKPTTRLTSDENDFVKAKTPPTLLRRDEEKSYSNLDFSYFVFQSPKVHLTIQKRVKRWRKAQQHRKSLQKTKDLTQMTIPLLITTDSARASCQLSRHPLLIFMVTTHQLNLNLWDRRKQGFRGIRVAYSPLHVGL